LGDQDFETARHEGAALSTEEAIAYTQRGRGERKYNIATRLFVSPQTVDGPLWAALAHLLHGCDIRLEWRGCA
jgi:hypothetical protein